MPEARPSQTNAEWWQVQKVAYINRHGVDAVIQAMLRDLEIIETRLYGPKSAHSIGATEDGHA